MLLSEITHLLLQYEVNTNAIRFDLSPGFREQEPRHGGAPHLSAEAEQSEGEGRGHFDYLRWLGSCQGILMM